MPYHHGRRRLAVRAAAVTGCASLLSALAVAGATPGFASAAKPLAPAAPAVPVTRLGQPGSNCHLGKHVIELTFDNVHFFRDNPNVPSDLGMMPSLLHFLEGNGTFASNNHPPLIAHTADDLLTTFTGLYGDRAGMPVSNSYQAYSTDGATDPAGSFAYWTDPIFDTAKTPWPRRLHQRAGRAGQREPVLRRPGAVLQPGVRHLLQAAGRRRHHPEELAVHRHPR
jgi:hypothetical protein